ncbi:MAG: aldose epimerase family protein [Mariniblastus sp.]
MAVFMRANAPNKATAENALAESAMIYAPIQEQQVGTIVEMEIVEREYGNTKDGKPVKQFICKNLNGYVLEVVDYGATVTGLMAPDKDGKVENITLSCTDIEGYEACTSYFGSTVGRYCNRIAKGKFSIDGTEYTLATNNGENHLHGGKIGLDKKIWSAEKILDKDSVGIRFSIVSEDGDEGYPGKLEVTVDYILNNQNELKVEFTAKTDKTTHVNLTNHNYWNLAGAGSGKILDHVLTLECDKYIPVDDQGIPTGELADVAGTFFDFKTPTVVGSRFDQIKTDPIGYDHCYVLRSETGELALAATVVSPKSGRKMEIHTTQPGIQFYTGNFLNGQPGSGSFDQHNALCLETQHYPDSPNQASFPSTILKPGQEFKQTTVHKFSIVK